MWLMLRCYVETLELETERKSAHCYLRSLEMAVSRDKHICRHERGDDRLDIGRERGKIRLTSIETRRQCSRDPWRLAHWKSFLNIRQTSSILCHPASLYRGQGYQCRRRYIGSLSSSLTLRGSSHLVGPH